MASTTATSKLSGRVAAIHLGHNNNTGGGGGVSNGNGSSITSGGSVSSDSSVTFDGLPKTFISAMRTLFDIMADKRTGHVRFADIEKRWQEGSDGMPLGVIDSLRKWCCFLFSSHHTFTLVNIVILLNFSFYFT